MSLVTVHEFMAIAALDAERVLQLAAVGKLPFHRGPCGELLIELDGLTLETLVLAPQLASEIAPESARQLQEIIAAELVSAAPSILGEALELALKWRAAGEKFK